MTSSLSISVEGLPSAYWLLIKFPIFDFELYSMIAAMFLSTPCIAELTKVALISQLYSVVTKLYIIVYRIKVCSFIELFGGKCVCMCVCGGGRGQTRIRNNFPESIQ